MKDYAVFSVLCWFTFMPALGQDNSRTPSNSELPPSATFEDKYLQGNNEAGKVMPRRKFKKTYLYWFYDHHERLKEDFYKRKKKVLKKYRRQNKLLEKPQYRDHSYFGHKKKPKIRSVDKRKFCKECGIRH